MDSDSESEKEDSHSGIVVTSENDMVWLNECVIRIWK